MWRNIVDFIISVLSKMGEFCGLLFTKLKDLPQYTDIMGNTGFQTITNMFPDWKVIDMIGVSGIIFAFVWLLIKKIDIFA